MKELTEKFYEIIENFKKKNHNLLDFENIKMEKDYVELMQKIQKYFLFLEIIKEI